jgi:hypothetical protein
MPSFNYFYISDPGGFNKETYPQALPSNGGESVIDVYNDHYWKMGSLLEEIPSIHLKEYKLEYGRWTASLVRMLKVVKSLISSTREDPYANMYLGEPTGFNYRLPYLISNGGTIRGSMSNSWVPTSGDVFGMLSKMMPETSNLVNKVMSGLAPGWGTEDIMRYAGTSVRSIVLKFPLYNTSDLKTINDNYSFISLFGLQNLKTRTSWTTFLPPKVYTVDTMADGGIYMPMAFVTNFNVEAMGQLRNYTDLVGGVPSNLDNSLADYLGFFDSSKFGKLIPEAYIVTITLTEALPESTNIMVGAFGGNKVSVISKQPPGLAGVGGGFNLGPGGSDYSVGNVIGNSASAFSSTGSGLVTSSGTSEPPLARTAEEVISPWRPGEAPNSEQSLVVPDFRETQPNLPQRPDVNIDLRPEFSQFNEENAALIYDTPVLSETRKSSMDLISTASDAQAAVNYANQASKEISDSPLSNEDKFVAFEQVQRSLETVVEKFKKAKETPTNGVIIPPQRLD